MKTIKVEIVRSTPKAHLLKDAEGRECWIQRRWLRDDGTISAQTFEKGVARKTEAAELVTAMKKADTDFRNGFHPVQILGESESGKAVSVLAEFSDTNEISCGSRRIWLPKSQIKDGSAPGWLLIAKARELGEALIGGQNHFAVTIQSIGGVELNETIRPVRW